MAKAAEKMERPTGTASSGRPQPRRQPRATILFLCPELAPQASVRATIDLAMMMNRNGLRSVMASPGGFLAKDAERAGIRQHQVPKELDGLLQRWAVAKRLAAIAAAESAAMIHATSAEYLCLLPALQKICTQPIVLDVRHPHDIISKRARQDLRQFVAAGGQIAVPSVFMNQRMIREFGVPKTAIHLVDPGIDIEMFHPSRMPPERVMKLAHLWRVPEQASVILLSAPLSPGFGQGDLIQALAALKRRDFYVVMVGDDRQNPGYRGTIETMIVRHKLQGKIILPETCPDWIAACWLSNLMVAANSMPCGENLELLAAQAVGRPVIVTDQGANPELVIGGETAWIVRGGDIPMLTAALDEALGLSSDQMANLTDPTRAFVAARFPIEEHLDAVLGLYDRASEDRKRRRVVG